MEVCLHEIVNREVVLAIVEPRASSDDLFEFDHRVDRAHENDVADIPGIDSGRELLRRSQNRGDGPFIVLKVPEMLVAEFAIVCRDPLAIIRIVARFHLIDEVTHGECVILRGAEDQRFLFLVDLVHEQLYAVRFALFDLDNFVEVGFGIAFPRFNFALYNLVVRRVDVLVERCGNLLYAEWRKEAVIDPFLERVDVNWLAEIGIGVDIVLALGVAVRPSCTAGAK